MLALEAVELSLASRTRRAGVLKDLMMSKAKTRTSLLDTVLGKDHLVALEEDTPLVSAPTREQILTGTEIFSHCCPLGILSGLWYPLSFLYSTEV